MASITKGMNLSGVSMRSIVLTLLVILLIVALFFIPEIINLQKSIIGVGSGSSSPPAKEAQAPQAKQSALEQISSMITGGYIDQLKAKKVVANAPAMQSKGVKAGGDKAGNIQGQKLSWDDIKSKESAQALRQAQREALALAKLVPADKASSRFALFSFSSAIDMVLEGADKSMSAEDAVRYLEYSQLLVTRAFEREGVERGEANRWIEVTLGPAVDKRGALRIARERIPFNPKLTLSWVKIYQPAGKYGQWKDQGPAYLYLKGYVMGSDVKNIEVLLNGNRVLSITPKPGNAIGRRNFQTRQLNARGIYTFRVSEKYGQVYEKSYAFYPRVRKFPWRKGLFEIPFRGEKDVRLDSYFTRRAGRVIGQNEPSGDVAEGAEYTKF